MTEVTAKMVSELRQKTGAGLVDCKKALEESNGAIEEAVVWLKKKGIASAAKKAGRDAQEGLVHSYIHLGGKLGVLIEVNCETDFVARNDEFKQLVIDLCMQIAAASPIYVKREDIPADLIAKEREIAIAQCEGKPEAAVQKIVDGKLDKWFSDVCLMEQIFVKNQSQTIASLLTEKISKIGENIIVRRFSRYKLGE